MTEHEPPPPFLTKAEGSILEAVRHFGEEGMLPTVARIAERTELSERIVATLLPILEEGGFVVRLKRGRAPRRAAQR